MNAWAKVGFLATAMAIGFGGGFYMAALRGDATLSAATASWAEEREKVATARADAEAAQRRAEQGQAEAISQAATNYQKGKADAEATSAATVADLRSGALRLRDQWATCRAASATVLSAAGGPQPDGRADDREASAGRIVRAASQCDAQVRGLQEALIGERKGQQ